MQNLFLFLFIVSDYDSFRFSLSFSASFEMVFVEPGAAPPVHAKISGTKLLSSIARILCWYFYVLTLMMFVSVRYGFRAGFSLGVENYYIEKRSAESASPESIRLDVKSSLNFSSGCFVVKGFAFQLLKFRLYFNIMAYFVQVCRRGIANFILS